MATPITKTTHSTRTRNAGPISESATTVANRKTNSVPLIGHVKTYGEHMERTTKQHEAREEIIRQIIKAKRDAGYPLKSVFFKDVWPPALEALNKQNGKQMNTRYVAVIDQEGKEPVWIENILSYTIKDNYIHLHGTDFESFVGIGPGVRITLTENQ